MTVRAKLVVVSITDNGQNAPKTIKFQTQYDGELPEDQRFCAATPWGEFTTTIANPAALEQFTIGKAFYVDFSPVEAAPGA